MPLPIPDLSKLIQDAGEKLIEREEDEAANHNDKSGAYYNEAAKACGNGDPEGRLAVERASNNGDEESKKADDIDKQIEGKKEMLALVKEILKAAERG